MAHAAVSDAAADVDSLVRPVRRADLRGKEKQTGVALDERPARTKRVRPITGRLAPRAPERKKKQRAYQFLCVHRRRKTTTVTVRGIIDEV